MEARPAGGLRRLRRPDGRDGETTLTRLVAAPGGSLRYYVVPRYFLEVESRYELGATWEGPVFGVGFGTHLLR